MRKATGILAIIFAIISGVVGLILFILSMVLFSFAHNPEVLEEYANTNNRTIEDAQTSYMVVAILILVFSLFFIVGCAIQIVIATFCYKNIYQTSLVILGILCVVFGFSIIVGILSILSRANVSAKSSYSQ